MHPRTEEIIAHLDANRSMLARAVEDVPPPLREQRPAPDRWSVAEVIEHLALVEHRITKTLAEQLAAARADGLGAEREASAVVTPVVVARVLDRRRPVTASDAVQPRAGLRASAAWEELTRSREALHAFVRATDGLALGEVRATHTVLGPLDFYQWLVFVGAHEARHAEQIREIGASLRSAP